jgi:glycosyltransferase involved in cell wall biosynthesis
LVNYSVLVLHVISNLNIGGAELLLKRLASDPLFCAQGIEHQVVSLRDEGVLGPALKAQGVTVRALNAGHVALMPLAFFRLYRQIRRTKPDVVQTWMVHSDLLGGLAARLAGLRSVVWGVRTTDYSVESRSTRWVRWICARLSEVVPVRIVCAAQASLLNSQAAGYAADKLMVIPNGFDVAQLSESIGSGQAIRQSLALEPGICVVGCLGRYNPAKDHANFASAAGLLAQRFPKVRFLMVGRGLDAGNPELMQCIDATGYRERFVLLGERADPAACLDAMNVFVLSSCTEGFPNALGEAMVMGLPCVSTDVGDAAFLMGSRHWLVPARDSKALANQLTELLTLPEEERKRLGAQARQRVVELFSMTATSQQFMNLYISLVKTKV